MVREFRTLLERIQQEKNVSHDEMAGWLAWTGQQFEDALEGRRQLFYDDLSLLEDFLDVNDCSLLNTYQQYPPWRDLLPLNGASVVSADGDLLPVIDEEGNEYLPTPWDIVLTVEDIPLPVFDPADVQSIREGIGYIIAQCRRERGWSVEKCSLVTGINWQSLATYEHGTRFPKMRTCEEFAKAFNASPDLFSPFYEAMASYDEQKRQERAVLQARLRAEKSQKCVELAKPKKEARARSQTSGKKRKVVSVLAKETNVLEVEEGSAQTVADVLRHESVVGRPKRAISLYWETIEAILITEGDVHTAGTMLGVDRSAVTKRLAAIFEEEPALEFIVFESLPPQLHKKKRTYQRAMMRVIHERLQREYSPSMRRKEKEVLAQSVGFKSWFSLERMLSSQGMIVEYFLETPIPEKPWKEYSCPWPRAATSEK